MVDEKGLDPNVADAIGEYVHNHGGIDVLEKMEADEKLGNNKSGKAGIDDMKLLLRYCELFGVLDKVKYCRVFS
jgi:histidyl-tRNA synthetase